MNDYLLLMHNDAPTDADRSAEWTAYFAKLRRAGAFDGGSSIGEGICMTKSKTPPDVTPHLAGYIRLRASDLDQARELVIGNPVFEAGGTVEIRALPRD